MGVLIWLFVSLVIYIQVSHGLIYPYGSQTQNLAESLRQNKFTNFYELLRKAEMYSVLYEKDAYTVFAPTNDVINKHLKYITDIKSYVEFHIIKGKFEVNQIKDGSLLKTYKGNHVILNKLYDHITKTVKIWIQGFPVIDIKVNTENKKLYKIEDFLQKKTQNVYDYLRDSGQHKIFYELFTKHKIYFQFPFGTTLFAPLDLSFQKLPDTYKELIFSSDQETRNFIRNHIVSIPMCRERLFHTTGWIRIKNSVGRYFSLYQDSFNKQASYVFGGSMLTSKVLSDGFLYGITEIILPNIERKTLEQVEYLECYTFTQYLISIGYLNTLSNLLQYHTVFAPTDQAFENLNENIKNELKNNTDYFLYVMKYHILNGKYLSQNFNPFQKMKTNAYDVNTKTYLNLNSFYGTEVSTVQSSIITSLDNLAVNGIIHVIDQVLIPPTQTIYQIISESKKLKEFQHFLNIWNETSILKNLNNTNGVYWTILAPTNKGLRRFYERHQNQPLKFKEYIFRHFLPIPFYSRQILRGTSMLMNTLAVNNNKVLQLRINSPSVITERLRIDNFNAEVIKEDLIGTNGVIHIVNEVFETEQL